MRDIECRSVQAKSTGMHGREIGAHDEMPVLNTSLRLEKAKQRVKRNLPRSITRKNERVGSTELPS